MESIPNWLLMDAQLRWIYLTPRIIPADKDEGRLSNVHKLHISLADERTSTAICGNFPLAEYHPWPLKKTRSVGKEDACVSCVRMVQYRLPNALVSVNRLLYIQGSIAEVLATPPAPAIPPAIIEQMGQVAALTAQVQSLIGGWSDWLSQSGVHVPDELAALRPSLPALPSADSLVHLTTYEKFHEWVSMHPTGFVAIARREKRRIHYAWCEEFGKQTKRTYTLAIGAEQLHLLREELHDSYDMCSHCFTSSP